MAFPKPTQVEVTSRRAANNGLDDPSTYPILSPPGAKMSSVNGNAAEAESHHPVGNPRSEEPQKGYNETMASHGEESPYRPRSPSWRLPTPSWPRLSNAEWIAATDPHRPQNIESNKDITPFPTFEEPKETRKPRAAKMVAQSPNYSPYSNLKAPRQRKSLRSTDWFDVPIKGFDRDYATALDVYKPVVKCHSVTNALETNFDYLARKAFVEQLDTCTTWRSVSMDIAELLCSWSEWLLLSLELLLQSQLRRLDFRARQQSSRSESTSHVSEKMELCLRVLIQHMIGYMVTHQSHLVQPYSLDDLQELVLLFLISCDCLETVPSQGGPDAVVEIGLQPQNDLYHSRTPPLNMAYVVRKMDRLAFPDLCVFPQEGKEFLIVPRYHRGASIKTTDQYTHLSFELMPSVPWLRWDEKLSGFRGVVPLFSDLRNGSSGYKGPMTELCCKGLFCVEVKANLEEHHPWSDLCLKRTVRARLTLRILPWWTKPNDGQTFGPAMNRNSTDLSQARRNGRSTIASGRKTGLEAFQKADGWKPRGEFGDNCSEQISPPCRWPHHQITRQFSFEYPGGFNRDQHLNKSQVSAGLYPNLVDDMPPPTELQCHGTVPPELRNLEVYHAQIDHPPGYHNTFHGYPSRQPRKIAPRIPAWCRDSLPSRSRKSQTPRQFRRRPFITSDPPNVDDHMDIDDFASQSSRRTRATSRKTFVGERLTDQINSGPELPKPKSPFFTDYKNDSAMEIILGQNSMTVEPDRSGSVNRPVQNEQVSALPNEQLIANNEGFSPIQRPMLADITMEEAQSQRLSSSASTDPMNMMADQEGSTNTKDVIADQEDSSNSMDVMADQENPTNPKDAMADKEDSINPEDAMADKEDSTNPEDAIANEEDSTNPEDAMADEEDRGRSSSRGLRYDDDDDDDRRYYVVRTLSEVRQFDFEKNGHLRHLFGGNSDYDEHPIYAKKWWSDPDFDEEVQRPSEYGEEAQVPSEHGEEAQAPYESGEEEQAPTENSEYEQAPYESGEEVQAPTENSEYEQAPYESGEEAQVPEVRITSSSPRKRRRSQLSADTNQLHGQSNSDAAEQDSFPEEATLPPDSEPARQTPDPSHDLSTPSTTVDQAGAEPSPTVLRQPFRALSIDDDNRSISENSSVEFTVNGPMSPRLAREQAMLWQILSNREPSRPASSHGDADVGQSIPAPEVSPDPPDAGKSKDPKLVAEEKEGLRQVLEFEENRLRRQRMFSSSDQTFGMESDEVEVGAIDRDGGDEN